MCELALVAMKRLVAAEFWWFRDVLLGKAVIVEGVSCPVSLHFYLGTFYTYAPLDCCFSFLQINFVMVVFICQ